MTTYATRIALAIGALAIMTSSVQAAPLDQVRIDPPVVKVVARDPGPMHPSSSNRDARVIPDPDTLTTDSGVVLLNDYIREAARSAASGNPMVPDNGSVIAML